MKLSASLNSLKFAANAPNLVSCGLIVTIAVQVAITSWSIHRIPADVLMNVSPTLAASRRAGVDPERIVAAHLFGVASAGPEASVPIPTLAKLVLAGTITTGANNRGVAIIGADGEPARVYSVGESVAGASLYSVHTDHVLLDRHGVLESLMLPLASSAGIQTSRPSHEQTASRQPRRADRAEQIAEPAPLPEQHPATLSDVAQLSPSVAGNVKGYRVLGGKDHEAFRASGLRPGDLVTAINGASLQEQSPQDAQQSFNAIQSGHTVLTVMRAGQLREVSVDIAQ